MRYREDDKYWYFLGLRVPKKPVCIYTRSGSHYAGDITEVSNSYVHLHAYAAHDAEDTHSAVCLTDIEAVVQITPRSKKQDVLACIDSIGSSGYAY